MTPEMLSVLEAGDDLIVSERQIAWATVRQHKTEYPEVLIDSPEKACAFLEDILTESPIELLYVLALDSSNRVLGCSKLATGSVNRAVIYPRLLVSFLLSTNATACLLLHGHPTGQLQFSLEDYNLTRGVGEMLAPLDITLLDHLLFVPEHKDSPAAWLSMRKEGRL
jgi:DNA repair protein RadC